MRSSSFAIFRLWSQCYISIWFRKGWWIVSIMWSLSHISSLQRLLRISRRKSSSLWFWMRLIWLKIPNQRCTRPWNKWMLSIKWLWQVLLSKTMLPNYGVFLMLSCLDTWVMKNTLDQSFPNFWMWACLRQLQRIWSWAKNKMIFSKSYTER